MGENWGGETVGRQREMDRVGSEQQKSGNIEGRRRYNYNSMLIVRVGLIWREMFRKYKFAIIHTFQSRRLTIFKFSNINIADMWLPYLHKLWTKHSSVLGKILWVIYM